jgi:hypothetical protein
MIISSTNWELGVQSYLNLCNITSTTPRKQLRDFAAGVNDLGLWSNMVCWPLRSTQNAGTGTTAYSLGGLGTFNGTLVNGPSWSTDGIVFVAASSQEITVGDAMSFTSQPSSLFVNATAPVLSGARSLIARWNVSNNRSYQFNAPTAGFRVSPSGLNEGPTANFTNASIDGLVSGHYQPSTHVRVYRGSVLDSSNTTSVPSAAFNATATTGIGSRVGADYFDGTIRLVAGFIDVTLAEHEALIPIFESL